MTEQKKENVDHAINKPIVYEMDTVIRYRLRLEYAIGRKQLPAVEQAKERFLEVYMLHGGMIKPTLSTLKIRYPTYDSWVKEDPDFRRKMDLCEEELMSQVEDRLKYYQATNEPWAIRFTLSRRHPKYKKQPAMVVVPNVRTLEDLLDEHGQSQTDTVITENTKQASTEGKILAQPGPTLLLGEKDKKKSDTEGSSKGDK